MRSAPLGSPFGGTVSPKAFPIPGGRWHGAAVTDEGDPRCCIAPRADEDIRPYAAARRVPVLGSPSGGAVSAGD